MTRHIRDILLEKETRITEEGKDGTYIAVHFSRKTQNQLKALAKLLEVDNVVERKKMHCTVVYSRKPFKNFTIYGKLKEPWIGKPTELEIFETQSGSRALVLRFDCPKLVERHEYFEKEYGATYDFDEYKIHSTLSYDVGPDWQIPKDIKVTDTVPEIEITEEYYEPLSLDWAKGADDMKEDDETEKKKAA